MKYEINETGPRHKETMHIIDCVCKALGIHIKQITGKSRNRDLVDARRICYVILKKQMNLPAVVIGGYFDKDHANILYHLKCHDMLYDTYTDYQVRYDKALKRVGQTDFIEDDMYDCINNMLSRIETLEKLIKIGTV